RPSVQGPCHERVQLYREGVMTLRADSRRILAEATRQEWVEALQELHQAEQEFAELGDDFSYQRWAEARSRVGRIHQRMKWRQPQQSVEDVWRLEEVNALRADGLDPLTGLPERLVQVIDQAIKWLLIAGSLIVVVIQVAMWWGRQM